MPKPGRNDPCPCGSGKKYKKCCLVSVEDADFQYRRLRQIEASLVPRLLEHAFETFGEECLLDAWDEFYFDESDEEPDPKLPMNMIFMPWFLFNWTTFKITDDGGSMPLETTVAESFLRTYKSRLSPDEQMLLAATNRSPFTFCEVIEVKPGVGMTQFDLLRRLDFEVIEHAASQTLRRGDIVYCSTTLINGVTSNIATGPYSLRPTAKRDILELREWILTDSESDEISDDHLDDYEADIRDLYLDWVNRMLDPFSQITNTDGHPMLPQKVCFDIESADQAFHALKDLAEGVEESDLLSDAQMEEGRVVSVEMPWFGGSAKARKRLRGPVLLGHIRIDDRKMVVEVNSDERAELILEQIAERLGESATYTTTLVEPLEAQLAAAAERAESGQSSFLSMKDAPPELLAKFEEMNRQHWEAWFDEPIPALNYMTPREASQTEEGRDLLQSLLLEYERHQDDPSENIFNPDVPALRRELGLE